MRKPHDPSIAEGGRYRPLFLAVSAVCAALLQACATTPSEPVQDPRAARAQSSGYNKFISEMEQRARDAQTQSKKETDATSLAKPRSDPGENYKVFGGTGETVRKSAESSEPAGPTTATLAFEATDIRDVVKTVLFDILGENYYIDPQVGSNVTFTFCDGRGAKAAQSYALSNPGNLRVVTPDDASVAAACGG